MSANSDIVLAAFNGDIEAIKSSLKDGADINAVDGDGNSPLIVSIIHNESLDIVSFLLESGAHCNYANMDKGGSTALHWAALLDRLDIAEVVFSYGAHADPAGPGKYTPLMMAIANNASVEMIELLIQHGADVNVRCDAEESVNKTPLYVAASFRNLEAIESLINYGADYDDLLVDVNVHKDVREFVESLRLRIKMNNDATPESRPGSRMPQVL